MTYHRMTRAAKTTHALEAVREPHVRCPACEVATTVRDLLAHVRERCTGRPAPHPAERWVMWREAIALGLSEATLGRAVASGLVRSRDAELLMRDLVLLVAWTRTLEGA